LAVVGNSGRAQSMFSALFVNHDNPMEVDMLRLVESPPGHLRGSLVVSSLNADGSRKKDAVNDVSGTMTRPNVSLQLEGGLVGLAEFLWSLDKPGRQPERGNANAQLGKPDGGFLRNLAEAIRRGAYGSR